MQRHYCKHIENLNLEEKKTVKLEKNPTKFYSIQFDKQNTMEFFSNYAMIMDFN